MCFIGKKNVFKYCFSIVNIIVSLYIIYFIEIHYIAPAFIYFILNMHTFGSIN